MASNTLYLEKHHGWTGLLVEPIPHLFVECVRNRPTSKCVHCGLVPEGFDGSHVELVYMNAMSMIVDEDNVLDMDTHRRRHDSFKRHRDPLLGSKFLAPARTLSAVLAEMGWPQIDFFSLDVEGFELPVLRGLDFERMSPSAILVEDWDKTGVADDLISKGYHLAERVGKNALYEKRLPN